MVGRKRLFEKGKISWVEHLCSISPKIDPLPGYEPTRGRPVRIEFLVSDEKTCNISPYFLTSHFTLEFKGPIHKPWDQVIKSNE